MVITKYITNDVLTMFVNRVTRYIKYDYKWHSAENYAINSYGCHVDFDKIKPLVDDFAIQPESKYELSSIQKMIEILKYHQKQVHPSLPIKGAASYDDCMEWFSKSGYKSTWIKNKLWVWVPVDAIILLTLYVVNDTMHAVLRKKEPYEACCILNTISTNLANMFYGTSYDTFEFASFINEGIHSTEAGKIAAKQVPTEEELADQMYKAFSLIRFCLDRYYNLPISATVSDAEPEALENHETTKAPEVPTNYDNKSDGNNTDFAYDKMPTEKPDEEVVSVSDDDWSDAIINYAATSALRYDTDPLFSCGNCWNKCGIRRSTDKLCICHPFENEDGGWLDNPFRVNITNRCKGIIIDELLLTAMLTSASSIIMSYDTEFLGDKIQLVIRDLRIDKTDFGQEITFSMAVTERANNKGIVYIERDENALSGLRLLEDPTKKFRPAFVYLTFVDIMNKVFKDIVDGNLG